MTMDFRRMIMLYSDSYKQCHPLMYPDNQEYLVSYLTARKAMNDNFPKMVVYGIQPFILNISDSFSEFFNANLEDVMHEYDHYIGVHLGVNNVARDRIVELHELGPDIPVIDAEIRRINRAMDRSRRASNPEYFNEDGTIRKGRKKWHYSNRYSRMRKKRKELYRKRALQLKT